MSGASRWRLVAEIAWRFLRGRRRSRLLDGTARSALVATTIGVSAMVIAMALMSGYRRDLRQKLLGGNAAIIVYPLSEQGFHLSPETVRRIESMPGVEDLRHVAYGRGTLASETLPDGVDVTLRGEPPELLAERPAAGSGSAPAAEDPPAVLLGSELASRLGLQAGDSARLMVVGMASGRPRFRYQGVRVAGRFSSGLSEFDRRLVVLDRRLLSSLSGEGVGAGLFELVLDDFDRTDRTVAELAALLGPDYLVRDWQDLNAELFTALRLQQIALFFVLGLIVLVSTFNVASSLVVLVRERMREVGVLAALGMPPRHLRWTFLLFGGGLGLVGTAGGLALGSGVSWLATRYRLIRFDPEVAEVYFMSSVSFQVRPLDLAAVAAFTLAVTLVACWLPARRAGRVRPARALRYE